MSENTNPRTVHFIIPCGHTYDDRLKLAPVSDLVSKSLIPIQGHTLLTYLVRQIDRYPFRDRKLLHFITAKQSVQGSSCKGLIEKACNLIALQHPFEREVTDEWAGDPECICDAIDTVAKNAGPDDVLVYHPNDVIIAELEKTGHRPAYHEAFIADQISRALGSLDNDRLAIIAGSRNFILEGIVERGGDPNRAVAFEVRDFAEKEPLKTFGNYLFSLGILLFNKEAWENLYEHFSLIRGVEDKLAKRSFFKVLARVFDYVFDRERVDRRHRAAYATLRSGRSAVVPKLVGYQIDNDWFHFDTYSQMCILPTAHAKEWEKVVSGIEDWLRKPLIDRVLLSHSKADKQAADIVYNLLKEEAAKTPHRVEVLYTSSCDASFGTLGRDFVQSLREQFGPSTLLVAVLSEDYFKSPYCLCEMGASWVGSYDAPIPVCVKGFRPQQVQGVITPTTLAALMDDPQWTTALRREVRKYLDGEMPMGGRPNT